MNSHATLKGYTEAAKECREGADEKRKQIEEAWIWIAREREYAEGNNAFVWEERIQRLSLQIRDLDLAAEKCLAASNEAVSYPDRRVEGEA